MAKPRKRFENSMMQEAYEKGYLSPYPDIVHPQDQFNERVYSRKNRGRSYSPKALDAQYIVEGQQDRYFDSPLGQIARAEAAAGGPSNFGPNRRSEEMDAYYALRDQDERQMQERFESQTAPEALRRPYLPPEIPPSNAHSGALGRIPFMRTPGLPLDVFFGASEEQSVPESLRRPGLPPELTLREQEEQAYWEDSELGQIKYDEDFRPKVYKDSREIDTIGYGFNLERPEAQAELDHAGINKTVADLRSGKQSLTEAEADILIRSEVPKFESAAMNFVGEETWNSLPRDKQNILTNMAFNLGSTRLNKFNNLRAAIQAGDYQKAKDEMYDSEWRKQVTNRATRLMDRMAAPDPYAMNPAPGYDIRNLFDDMGREDFDVGSAIEDALRRRG